MYTWIWRHLPGPTRLRVLCAVLLVLAAVAALFTVAFPWLEPMFPLGGSGSVESGGP